MTKIQYIDESRLLWFLLILIVLTNLSCSKKNENQNVDLKQGTYSLSSTVYYDEPILYTKQNTTKDTQIIRNVLNHFANDVHWSDYIHDSLQYTFELNKGVKILDNPIATSSFEILPESTALLINFPNMKDSMLCDIVKNSDGTYTFIDRDSSYNIGISCLGLETTLLDIIGFQKYKTGVFLPYMSYKGRDSFIVNFKNGQVEIHASSLFVYSNHTCMELIVNSLKRYLTPEATQMSVDDTVVVQHKKFVYMKG